MKPLAILATLALAACYSPSDCPDGITPLARTRQDSTQAEFTCVVTTNRTRARRIDSAQRAMVKP